MTTTLRSIAVSALALLLGACGLNTNYTACLPGHACNATSTFSQNPVWGTSGSAASTAPISKEQLPVVSSPAWVSPDAKPLAGNSSGSDTLGLPTGTVVNKGDAKDAPLTTGTVVNEDKADVPKKSVSPPPAKASAPPSKPKQESKAKVPSPAPSAKPTAAANPKPAPPPTAQETVSASAGKPTCLRPPEECPSWTQVPKK